MSDDERRDVDGDELGEPEPLEPDERERVVRTALQRFYGGDFDGGEYEEGRP